MDSLQWVDQTYYAKHKSEDPNTLRATYYPNLRMYSTHGNTSKHKAPMDAAIAFLYRYGRRAAMSLGIYMLSYLPIVGRFVLPAASFYTFNNAVGPIPATVIFGSGVFLPRRYLVIFLQSYFSSRSLMRELVWMHDFHASFLIDTDRDSSSHTSPGSVSTKNKSGYGSVIVKAFFSVSGLDSTYFLRYHCWVSSFTGLRKHPLLSLSPKSPTPHHHQPTARSLLKVRYAGPTNMSFYDFH